MLLRTADVAAAMSVEALLGTDRVLAADLMALRPHPGQGVAADNMRRLLEGSMIVASHRGPEDARVQDAYSLRCSPQVQGAARDTVDHAATVAERELASAIDNPVVLDDGRVESNGNFHGAPLAHALDFLAGSASSRDPFFLFLAPSFPGAAAAALLSRGGGEGDRHPDEDRKADEEANEYQRHASLLESWICLIRRTLSPRPRTPTASASLAWPPCPRDTHLYPTASSLVMIACWPLATFWNGVLDQRHKWRMVPITSVVSISEPAWTIASMPPLSQKPSTITSFGVRAGNPSTLTPATSSRMKSTQSSGVISTAETHDQRLASSRTHTATPQCTAPGSMLITFTA